VPIGGWRSSSPDSIWPMAGRFTRICVHGDDDQILPIRASPLLSPKIVKGAELKNLQRRAARHVHDA
jgi:hypothetical protein